MKKITVHLKDRSYPILIGGNLLSKIGSLVKPLKLGQKILIVSNRKVASRYSASVSRSLRHAGFQVCSFLLSHSDERDKSERELVKLWGAMAQNGLDRSSAVLALGGGVVGDVSGFAVSTYMRGLAFIQVPTTLLAQVDSAIGGKTAIDLPQAKNMVGTFYQPQMVVSDVETLKTLRLKDVQNSFAEVIKYGVIQDPKLFELLEKKGRWFVASFKQKSFSPNMFEFLEEVISRSVSVKAQVVEADERETKGKRMILNYGHTFAHALEVASRFRMPHGEAVACGMILAGELALQMGLFSVQAQARQISLINRLSCPARYSFSSSKILSFMKRDKKARNGKLRFVLPARIGQVKVFGAVPEKWVRSVLDRYRSVR